MRIAAAVGRQRTGFINGKGDVLLAGRRHARKLHASAIGQRRPVEQGVVSPAMQVPKGLKRPPYITGEHYTVMQDHIEPLTEEEEQRMRVACKVAADVLASAGRLVEPGISTEEIDNFIHSELIRNNAYPSPLGYMDFARSSCISVNEIVCPGVPDSRQVVDGDSSKLMCPATLEDFTETTVGH